MDGNIWPKIKLKRRKTQFINYYYYLHLVSTLNYRESMNENQEIEKQRAIQNYIEEIQQIKRLSQETSNLSAAQFDEYVEDQFFLELRSTSLFFRPQHIQWRSHRKYVLPVLMLICVPLLVLHYKNTISTLFMTNIQGIIYPGMSWWRTFTIPLIIAFPGLTQLYDESCLVPNPLFQIKDLDCRPCMNVVNILDLTNVVDHQPQAVPYMFRVSDKTAVLVISIIVQ